MSRTATVTRKTRETNITVTLDLDGSGKADLHTGIGFFDHMLDGFARHGLFDLTLHCDGDLNVDCHHTIEDCGIALARRRSRWKCGSTRMISIRPLSNRTTAPVKERRLFMRILPEILLITAGLSLGFFIASGLVALVIGLGIVTRYAGITKTAAPRRGSAWMKRRSKPSAAARR